MIVLQNSEARDALLNGAYQSATITVYDATNTAQGYPAITSFTNANIIAGSLSVSKTGVSGDRLAFAGLISDEMKVKVRKTGISTLKLLGQMVTLSISWEHDGQYSPQIIYPFSGVITDVTRLQSDTYEITALDGLIAFDKPFSFSALRNPTGSGNLTYPVTIKNLAWSICISVGVPYVANTGIVYPETALPNETYTVSDIPEDKGYTYRQVLRWCCEIMGCNLKIGTGGDRRAHFYVVDDRLGNSQSQFYYLMDGPHLFQRISAGERPYDTYDSTYLLRIIASDEVVYKSSSDAQFKRKLEIVDNELMPLTGQTYELLGGYINAKWDAISTIPLYTRELSGTSVSMWFAEPYDWLRIRFGDESGTQTSAAVVTSVVHKLNGYSTIICKTCPDKVSAIDESYQATAPFNKPQGTVINALKGSITNFASSLGTVSGEVSTLQGDMSTTQGDVSSLQGSVGGLQSDVGSLQTSVTNLTNDLYYKAGDTYHAKYYNTFAAFFTGSQHPRSMYFSVRVNKSLKNISTITVTSCTGRINTVDGYALLPSGSGSGDTTNWLNTTGITITPHKIDNYNVRINIASTADFVSKNYTPATFAAQGSTGLTLSFS